MNKLPFFTKLIWIPLTAAMLASVLINHRTALADSQLILNTLLKTYQAYFAIVDAGVEKGDVFFLMLENRPDLLFIYAALAKIGAITALINTNLKGASLSRALETVPSKGVIVVADNL